MNDQPRPPADVLERLARVAAAIGKLHKDKRNTHSNYSYLSEEAIKTAINHHLPEGGTWHDSLRIEVLSDEWVNGKQGEENLIKVRAVITFGPHTYEGMGAGIDYRDKALMKAQTAAVREAWKNVFVIAGGGEPESDSERDNDRVESGRAQQGARRSEQGGGSTTIGFGMHKGKAWADVPSKYLEWLVEKGNNPRVRDTARAELERRNGAGREGGGDNSDPGFSDDDIPF